MRASTILFAAAVAVSAALSSGVEAGHVCMKSDCRDIVGDALVRDNLGHSKHFTERHVADQKELHRLKRVEVLRRQKASL